MFLHCLLCVSRFFPNRLTTGNATEAEVKLQHQRTVNTELKRLLVASVGDALAARYVVISQKLDVFCIYNQINIKNMSPNTKDFKTCFKILGPPLCAQLFSHSKIKQKNVVSLLLYYCKCL